VFRVSHKVSYKTVLKAHHSLILKADNMAEKLEWMAKLRGCIESPKDSSTKTGSVRESKSSDNIAALPSSVSDGPVVKSISILWISYLNFVSTYLVCLTKIHWFLW
jgi:dynamin GTPase